MKNVLCFGDSNTFGTDPADPGTRHPLDVRWPGRLASLLGDGWHVIEEGMSGRTSVFDNPLEPHRSGMEALPIVLQSHCPLDYAIVMLGTNDLKEMFNASSRIVAAGAEMVARAIRDYDYADCGPAPRILLVSPIHIKPGVPYASFAQSASNARTNCLAGTARPPNVMGGCSSTPRRSPNPAISINCT